ncbi:MAG TPA: cytochrome P450 [Edaphobacter sp.]|jgi:cytochrome P450|nr:cytochrome P450 [Edaphobacter sp.]
MHARREDPLKPAWSGDRLDSRIAPEIEGPYYDEELEAWVLSRYADVLAAFRSSGLWPAGSSSKKSVEPPDEKGNLQMRAETVEALSPAQLREWRESLTPAVKELTDGLPVEETVDLVASCARPLCLALAAMVTGIDPQDAERLRKIAEPVSASAAEPYDQTLRADAKSANVELRGWFHSGPEPLRDSGFVALSHTMPSLLANAWHALLQHPEAWKLLHEQPELMEQAMEELLRYAGVARILFRRATEDVDLGGVAIQKGERIVLRVFAANRDPERFADPCRFDVMRRGTGQLALGAGPHACVGASLIRMAAVTITRPLVERFAWAKLVEPVEWKGGAGFRTPRSLLVRLG